MIVPSSVVFVRRALDWLMVSVSRVQRRGPDVRPVMRNSALFAMKNSILIGRSVEVARQSKGVWMERAVLLVAHYASQAISLKVLLVCSALQ